MGKFQTWILSFIFLFGLYGCAFVTPSPETEETDYQHRAIKRGDSKVQVTTSVLSNDETLAIYGLPLFDKDMQPVWIQVENNDDEAYWLMFPGIDPYFFPVSEAADAFVDEKEDKRETERRFDELAFHNPIPPGSTVSGFVLTNHDEGIKMVQIDLVASGRFKSFSFLSVVPGFKSDYKENQVFKRQIYSENEIRNFTDESTFRKALESLPCCVTNKDASSYGDPLNLVIVGGVEDAFPALVRRGWRPTEETWSGSVMKMIKSALSGERYRYAPVSPLYLYDRPQDLALQKARDNIHQRNHLRLWLSPMRYQNKSVWVGQISRDIGSRLTIHSPYLTTHKIDPNVDEARIALTEDMVYSQTLVQFGMVKGVGAASKEEPRENLTTDPYYTDGFRVVLIFDAQPTPMTGITFLPWESREQGMIKHQLSHREQR